MVPDEGETRLKNEKNYQNYLDMEELSLKECHHDSNNDEEPQVIS